jgi:hypothetical protein
MDVPAVHLKLYVTQQCGKYEAARFKCKAALVDWQLAQRAISAAFRTGASNRSTGTENRHFALHTPTYPANEQRIHNRVSIFQF